MPYVHQRKQFGQVIGSFQVYHFNLLCAQICIQPIEYTLKQLLFMLSYFSLLFKVIWPVCVGVVWF
jgi:hypothetical protein